MRNRRLAFAVLAALVLIPAALSGQEGTDPFEPARRAITGGDGIAAEAELRRIMESGAKRSHVAALMGEAEMLQGDLAEARRWLGPGDFSQETRGLGFHLLGRLNVRQGDLPGAAAAFDNALTVIPDDPTLWVDIGRMRYLSGAQSQAVDAGVHAVELGPNNAAALQFRAQLLRDAEGPAAALSWFEAALKRNPDSLELLGDYAATLGEVGRAKDMLLQIRRMIEIDPENERAFFLQAVLAARADKNDLARRLLWRTGDAIRETPAGLLLSATIDLRSGNHRNAAQTYDRLRRLQPDNLTVRLLLARALSLGGLNRELVQRFSGFASRPDASPYLLTLMARAHEGLGERELAAKYINRAAMPRDSLLVTFDIDLPLEVSAVRWEREPTRSDRTREYVRQLMSAGQAVRAVRIANSFLGDHAGSVDALILAGDANLVASNFRDALGHYSGAAKIRRSFSLVRRMVFAHRSLGQKEKAAALVTEYLIANPLDGQAAGLAAEFAVEMGDFERASALLEHAYKQVGSEADPVLLAQGALVALQLDENQKALELAQRAYDLQRGHPAATLALARSLKANDGAAEQVGALLAKIDLSAATFEQPVG